MATNSTIAVAGASGFVGRHVVRELLWRGHRVRALVRDRDKALRHLPREGVTLVYGSAGDAEATRDLLTGCDACVNVIGILREQRDEHGAKTFEGAHVATVRALVRACEGAGVPRFVHVSALGVRPVDASEYQRTKWEGEQILRRSGLRWTILRPGLIHGADSEVVALVKGWASGHEAPWLFMPYFARGIEDKRVPLGGVNYVDPKVAPVAVQDVARAVASALTSERAVGEIYNIVGSETLTWPEMLGFMRDHLPGSNGELEPHGIPGDIAAIIARGAALAGLGGLLPFDEGMARMGSEDSTASLDKARQDLGFEPQGFRESMAKYAASV